MRLEDDEGVRGGGGQRGGVRMRPCVGGLSSGSFGYSGESGAGAATSGSP